MFRKTSITLTATVLGYRKYAYLTTSAIINNQLSQIHLDPVDMFG